MLVQSVGFLRDPVRFLADCQRRYGDVFRVRFLGMGNLLYVAEPGLAREVFATDRDIGLAGEARRPFLEPVAGPNSLLCIDGERWQRQRKLLGPPLHGEAIRSYRDQIAEIAADEVERWPDGGTFPLRPKMQAITLEVILRVVFGIEDADRLDRLRRLLPQLVRTGEWMVWLPERARNAIARVSTSGPIGRRLSPWSRFVAVRDEVDAILYDEIDRRRSEPASDRGDVLTLLLQARDEDGNPMTDEELRDELVTLLEAGHETTATGLAWAFERLTRSPRALERLIEEIDAGEERYLDAVVKETLRVRPVLLDVVRVPTEPMTIGGYDAPAGTYLTPAIVLIHLRPDLYEEPEEFRPERWLVERPPHQAWMPFGGGQRRCVGSHLALMEMRTVIAEVVKRVRLAPAEAEPERQRLHHITLVPSEGARVIAERRVREPVPA
jgi:cytochrome P450 family 135